MKNYLLFTLLLLCSAISCKENENPQDPLIPPETHKTRVEIPTDFATIQEAIDQAKGGDTLVVKPGTYSENTFFNGKSILLTSLFYLDKDISYISSTIINGSNGSVVQFMNKETKSSMIQGFTIKNGTGTIYTRNNGNITLGGGGILAFESSPTIRYNIIEDNVSTDVSGANAYGGGIRLELGSPIVHNNIIRNNIGNFGGGVFLDATSATFTNNLIE